MCYYDNNNNADFSWEGQIPGWAHLAPPGPAHSAMSDYKHPLKKYLSHMNKTRWLFFRGLICQFAQGISSKIKQVAPISHCYICSSMGKVKF